MNRVIAFMSEARALARSLMPGESTRSGRLKPRKKFFPGMDRTGTLISDVQTQEL